MAYGKTFLTDEERKNLYNLEGQKVPPSAPQKPQPMAIQQPTVSASQQAPAPAQIPSRDGGGSSIFGGTIGAITTSIDKSLNYNRDKEQQKSAIRNTKESTGLLKQQARVEKQKAKKAKYDTDRFIYKSVANDFTDVADTAIRAFLTPFLGVENTFGTGPQNTGTNASKRTA